MENQKLKVGDRVKFWHMGREQEGHITRPYVEGLNGQTMGWWILPDTSETKRDWNIYFKNINKKI
jgi:hypothetical protein